MKSLKKISIFLISIILVIVCSTSYAVVEKDENKESIEIVKEETQASKEPYWYGRWMGKNAGIDYGSELFITQKTESLIEFHMLAINHERMMEDEYYGEAKIVDKGKAIYTHEKGCGLGPIKLTFLLSEEGIKIESENFPMTGGHIFFNYEYVKDLNIQGFSAIERGLVDNESQQKILRELTREKYGVFIANGMNKGVEDNFQNYKINNYGWLGNRDHSSVIMLDTKSDLIIAVVNDGGEISYYSNDVRFLKEPPQYIQEWLDGRQIDNVQTEE